MNANPEHDLVESLIQKWFQRVGENLRKFIHPTVEKSLIHLPTKVQESVKYIESKIPGILQLLPSVVNGKKNEKFWENFNLAAFGYHEAPVSKWENVHWTATAVIPEYAWVKSFPILGNKNKIHHIRTVCDLLNTNS